MDIVNAQNFKVFYELRRESIFSRDIVKDFAEESDYGRVRESDLRFFEDYRNAILDWMNHKDYERLFNF